MPKKDVDPQIKSVLDALDDAKKMLEKKDIVLCSDPYIRIYGRRVDISFELAQ